MRRSLFWFSFVSISFLSAHRFVAALRIDDQDNTGAASDAVRGGDKQGTPSWEKRDDSSESAIGPIVVVHAEAEQQNATAGDGDVPVSGDGVVPPLHSLSEEALDAVRNMQDASDTDTPITISFGAAGTTTAGPEVVYYSNGQGKQISYLSLVMTIAVITLYCCFVVFGDANAKALEDKGCELKQLEFSYLQLMSDMEQKVQLLVDMQVDWSQHVFNTKKHDFIEFVTRVRDNPERYGNQADELLAPFKTFIKVWLDIFRESSMEPINEPFIPIPLSDIDRCGTINEVAEVIINKLEPIEIQFVELPNASGNRRNSVWQVDQELEGKKAERKAFLEKTQKARNRCMCSWANMLEMNPLYLTHTIEKQHRLGKNWFPLEINAFSVLRLNFLTCKHFALFVLFILMHLLMLTTWSIRADIAFLLMVITVVLMWIIMWRFEVFDLVGALKVMAIQIRSQKDAMMAKGKEIEEITKKIELPSQIWIFRTRPKLELIGGLCRKIASTKWPDAGNLKEFLDSANEGLEGMAKSCGTLQEFALLGEEAMKVVRQQAEAAADVIGKNLAKELQPQLKAIFMIPRLLVVRVVSCTDLPKGTWADDYDPYVRVRAKKDGRWLQTECKANQINPVWHTAETPCEFRFLLGGAEVDLQAEVMDENTVATDTFIGSAVFPVSELATGGTWETKKSALQDAGQGELTIECFLANDLENLAALLPMPIRHPHDEDSITEDEEE